MPTHPWQEHPRLDGSENLRRQAVEPNVGRAVAGGPVPVELGGLRLPGLLALLAAAKQEPAPFRKVYVLDTSRIARDTLQAQSLKYYLRKKRGIELTFLHLPQTGSYMDEAIEKMMEV